MRTDGTITDTLGGQRKAAPWDSKNGEQAGGLRGPVMPNSTRGRKRLARMLEAATELFLRDGYRGTSIDAILEASGGSKATLYNYFSTKDDLFRAVVGEAISSAAQPELDAGGDPRTTLTEFAVVKFEAMFSPRRRALLRLIVAERERFPDLAQKYYESGPLRNRRTLARFFANLGERHVLDAGTAEEAADFFMGVALNKGLIESLLLGEEPSMQAIRERAARAVDRFLAHVRASRRGRQSPPDA